MQQHFPADSGISKLDSAKIPFVTPKLHKGMHFTFEGARALKRGGAPLPKQLVMRLIGAITSLPKQVVLTMQLSAILLFAVCLQVCAAGYSQTVSFTGKDVPLKDVLASVKKQTGFGVFYANGEATTLESSGTVTIDLKNVPLDLFLKECLDNQPIEYNIEGNTIFIKKKQIQHTSLSLMSTVDSLKEIKGRVINKRGEPLQDANVIIKRTGKGTTTDASGNFTLHNVSEKDVIYVSFIGYKPQSSIIKGQSKIDFTMETASNDLDKIVIQAYGTTSKRLSTGNIATVHAEDIGKQPVMNVLESVQGQVPGVVVTNTSGYASASIKMEVRGRNTINPNLSSDPLYIIDGVPLTIIDMNKSDSYVGGSSGVIQSGISSPANGQSPFFNINPLDIESISILKDADATAIYGSRGANGVVLITTKKGAPGKTHLDISAYSGISEVPRHYRLLDTQQYIAMRKEALSNDGIPIDIYNAPDLIQWDTTRFTDWGKLLWGNIGKATDVQLNLSGGDTKTTFRVAGNYHHSTEILTSNGANNRGSLSFNLDHKSLNQKFLMNFTGNYSTASSNMIYFPGSAVTLPPNAPSIYDAKGNLNYEGWLPLDYLFPFGNFLCPYSTKTYMLNSSLSLSYEIFKGVEATLNLGYNNIQTTQNTLTTIASQDPVVNPKGSNVLGHTFVNNLIIEPQVEGNWFIGIGKLNVLVGYTFQKNVSSFSNLNNTGFPNDLTITNMSSAPIQRNNYSQQEYKYEGAFGRIGYNIKNKYIININARRDGSTHFGPGRQFGNFGSIGAAWIFTEENVLKARLPFLTYGKLRSSYGTTGGDQIGNFQYLSLWNFAQNTYNNIIPVIPIGHTDSLLRWQVNKKLEFSLDLSFFKDRLSLEATWYRNRCNDQLIDFPTPTFTGFGQVTSNTPANVQNMGWEFFLSGNIIDNDKIKWQAKFNIGINKNKLISYPNLSESPYSGIYVIGKPLNIVRLLKYTGIDPQTGTYTFEDKNHDGQITFDQAGKNSDDSYIKETNPKYDGGFTNTFTFRNWALSLFFYFRKQVGRNIKSTLNAPGDMTNQPTEVLNRWQKPGDKTVIPKFTTNPYVDDSFTNYQFFSDATITDASFIRLQNVSISYSLPENILKKTVFRSASFSIKANNLFLISHYNGLDPEVQNFQSLPLARIITGGINLNF